MWPEKKSNPTPPPQKKKKLAILFQTKKNHGVSPGVSVSSFPRMACVPSKSPTPFVRKNVPGRVWWRRWPWRCCSSSWWMPCYALARCHRNDPWNRDRSWHEVWKKSWNVGEWNPCYHRICCLWKSCGRHKACFDEKDGWGGSLEVLQIGEGRVCCVVFLLKSCQLKPNQKHTSHIHSDTWRATASLKYSCCHGV